MSGSDRFEGFVLAGGRSARMGRDKALIEFGGRTFLETALDALRPACRRVSVVVGRDRAGLIAGIPLEIGRVFDVFAGRGTLGGIHAALTECRARYAVVLGCDMPLITSEFIERLAGKIVDSGVSAVVPVDADGRLQPLCSIYDAGACLPLLTALLNEDDNASVRDFIGAVGAGNIDYRSLSSGRNVLANINTPEDLEAIRGRSGNS